MKYYWIIKHPAYERIIFFTKKPFEEVVIKNNGVRSVTLKYRKRDTFTMKLDLFKRFFNHVPNKNELIYIKVDPSLILFYGTEKK